MNPVLLTCVGFCSICISIGALIAVWRQPHIATLDMDRLIVTLSQPLAARYHKGNVPPDVLSDLVENIRSDLVEFASKRKITLLAKNACFSAEEDVTDDFLEEIQDEDR